MNKKILVLIVLFAIFCSLSTANAWLRDANIAFSRDSVGIGWYEGAAFTAEKVIDKETSVGIYALPTIAFEAKPINFYQISYNKQVIGKEEDAFSFSYYLGMFYTDYYKNHPSSYSATTSVFPDIGMAFRWRLNEASVVRMHTIFIMPFLIEWGYKFNNNIEGTLGFGYPFQLISLKYLF